MESKKMYLSFIVLITDNSACDAVPDNHGELHLRWRAAVFQIRGLGLPGRLLLLLHLAEHHRFRRHRARHSDLRVRYEFHLLLHVPDAGHGHHRHVLQPDAGGGDPQVPLVRQGGQELLLVQRQQG